MRKRGTMGVGRGMLLAAAVAVAAAVTIGEVPARAQAAAVGQGLGGRGGRGGGGSAQAAAPVDLTGYWVSIVTEDWRWRMVTPPKGDFTSVPLNDEGRRLTDSWDPAKDEAAGEQCKAYGAAAIMRVPERLHITWLDANTLQIETDAGMQTRDLHFGGTKPADDAPSWQGYSVAEWPAGGRGRGAAGPGEGRPKTLKVFTTGLRAGYLRKNGVPYSSNATVTEYFNRLEEFDRSSWLIVTTIIDDPKYLNQPFVTSSNFKRIPDASGWNPTPCEAK